MYHCPFCNLCRVGKGLGIDYFHCMTCNCCLGIKLVNHKCLEKSLETNCPICCDFLFTSSATVRAQPCGHYMHSACFQVSIFLNNLFPVHLSISQEIFECFNKRGRAWVCLLNFFQAYTRSHYTCPICSKSLGDMAVRELFLFIFWCLSDSWIICFIYYG